MPSYSHSLVVDATPDAVFAILDDTSRTPQWLRRCTGIDRLSDEPLNTVGTKLRYHYRQGRRAGTMEGQITAREPGRRLAMTYADRMMGVTVDFLAAPAEGGRTSLTHTITIRTKGLGVLFSPLISRQLPGQTIDAMTRLKTLAERQ